jgi:multidrug efflux pump subunit AcrA (membrane-fusion protein)
MMSWRRLLRLRVVGPSVLVFGLAAAAYAWSRGAADTGPIGSTVVDVSTGTIEDTLLVTGLVKPSVTIELRSEASGLVESISVKEGDRVVAGQVLLRLDSRVAQTAVLEAEANLQQARMQHAASELDLDEDTLLLRRKTLERTRALHEQGLISGADLETKELELRVAERSVERARRNQQINLARISQLEAAVERARAQLGHTIIRAPFDAWVTRRQVEVGSGVAGVSQSSSGGTVVMTLGDAREFSLQASVTAVDARRLAPGLPARLRLDSDPERVWSGTVSTVANAGDQDQQTRLTTFPVTIVVDGVTDAAWINVPARAEIVLKARNDVMVVPDTCIRTDASGRTHVFLHEAGRPARSQDVQIGTVSSDRVEITGGLALGQSLLCR